MTKFYLIRHGQPDYSYAEEHNFIGHGFDLSPLSMKNIDDVVLTSKNVRLKQAQIIISSPYTRALQTASIIAKEIGRDIIIEPDLMEWIPDLTYQYKDRDEMHCLYDDYIKNSGTYPIGEIRKWETEQCVKDRAMSVVKKYKGNYSTVIIVAHKMLFQSICDCGDMKPAEIFETYL